jgi:hypothetical protein
VESETREIGPQPPRDGGEQRISPLELCFDLIFHIAFRERVLGTFSPHRAVASVALLALIPLALGADALGALAAVAFVLGVLIAYEATHFREARARVRANPSASLAEMRGS